MLKHEISAKPPSSPASSGRLLGDPGIWVFIAGDLLLFSLFFETYLTYRANERELFARSQQALSQNLGIFNTFLLITSSWFIACATKPVRDGNYSRSASLVTLALLCACGFLINKGIEWSQLIGANRTLLTNDFFMFFFMLTGIHALHVLIGMGVLIYLLTRIRAGIRDDEPASVVMESGAVFWHLVDLLWIVLFSLFYLVR